MRKSKRRDEGSQPVAPPSRNGSAADPNEGKAGGGPLQPPETAGAKVGKALGALDRRSLVAGSAALLGGIAAVGALLRGGSAGAKEWPVPTNPMKVPGRPIGLDDGYGTRSQFETAARWRFPTPNDRASFSLTPLAESRGIVTPSGLHFERHHAGIPTIDPASHKLLIHGMVERPLTFTVEQLRRFPCESRLLFIECSGNSFTEWKHPAIMKNVQGTHGLTSTSEWAGVPLSTLLREVGVKPGAGWILAEGRDAAGMTRSVPLTKAWNDVLVAYGQNGEALRPEQGYPLRLIVPGWEGNIHIKWLRRLEIGAAPYMTREETSKYTDLLADGKARQFTFMMEAKSVITYPSGEMQLDGPGFHEITGIAWTGRGRVRRVEISTDGGRHWQLAQLEAPVLPICHTRFRFPWRWDGREAILQSRCTDETGYTQPTRRQLIAVRGDNGRFGSLYHFNGIQSWKVNRDGSVENVDA